MIKWVFQIKKKKCKKLTFQPILDGKYLFGFYLSNLDLLDVEVQWVMLGLLQCDPSYLLVMSGQDLQSKQDQFAQILKPVT